MSDEGHEERFWRFLLVSQFLEAILTFYLNNHISVSSTRSLGPEPGQRNS